MSHWSRALWACLLLLSSSRLWAKGDNEVGFGLSYLDRQATVDGEIVRTAGFTFDIDYLRSVKKFWTGVDFSYAALKSSVGDSGHLVLGVPFKYWIKGPESKGVGFYGIGTPYLGRSDEGTGSGSVLGLKMGPGVAVFISDLVAIDTRFYYDYRMGSNPSTTTGMLVGCSLFF